MIDYVVQFHNHATNKWNGNKKKIEVKALDSSVLVYFYSHVWMCRVTVKVSGVTWVAPSSTVFFNIWTSSIKGTSVSIATGLLRSEESTHIENYGEKETENKQKKRNTKGWRKDFQLHAKENEPRMNSEGTKMNHSGVTMEMTKPVTLLVQIVTHFGLNEIVKLLFTTWCQWINSTLV